MSERGKVIAIGLSEGGDGACRFARRMECEGRLVEAGWMSTKAPLSTSVRTRKKQGDRLLMAHHPVNMCVAAGPRQR